MELAILNRSSILGMCFFLKTKRSYSGPNSGCTMKTNTRNKKSISESDSLVMNTTSNKSTYRMHFNVKYTDF